jgi:hypothetical protein
VPHTYRADVHIRVSFERIVERITKHLGGGFEFYVYFETDNRNISHSQKIPQNQQKKNPSEEGAYISIT